MRRSRLSFVVGWAAVALLAIAGFAAFRDGTTSSELQTEAQAASIGHASGAYAGLAFAYLVVDVQFADPAISSSEALGAEIAALPFHQDTTRENDQDGSSSSPADYWLSEVEVRALVEAYFAPTDVNRAVRIAWCESRFDPRSVNIRTGGVGLFQHLPQYWEERAAKAGFPGADPTDPEASTAAAAWAVYHGGGWDVFACRD